MHRRDRARRAAVHRRDQRGQGRVHAAEPAAARRPWPTATWSWPTARRWCGPAGCSARRCRSGWPASTCSWTCWPSAEQRGDRVYFLGARPDVLARMLEEAGRRFPGLLVAGAQDGYYQAGQEGEIAEDIRRCRTDILFLGMSSPRKELFLGEWGTATKAHVRARGRRVVRHPGRADPARPVWYQEHGLEWLYRAYQEPVRLGRRYLTTNMSFIALVAAGEHPPPRRAASAGPARPNQAAAGRPTRQARTRQGSARDHGRRRRTGVRGPAAGHAGRPRSGTASSGYDVDRRRVKLLAAGESYIEDVPAGELSRPWRAAGSCRLPTSAACAGFDVAVVAAPTPLRDGLPDLTYLEDASRTLARHLRPGATVVVESTSYPGTTAGEGAADARGGVGAASRAGTSTSATARSGSTRATPPGRWSPRRRSSPGSTRTRCG